jgi:hypothetical protein
LNWETHTYRVADYVDNRMGMCVLAYDENNQLVKQVPRTPPDIYIADDLKTLSAPGNTAWR